MKFAQPSALLHRASIAWRLSHLFFTSRLSTVSGPAVSTPARAPLLSPAVFCRSFEEPTLSSESHAGPRKRPPPLHHTPRTTGRPAIPGRTQADPIIPGPYDPAREPGEDGLTRFNRASGAAAEAALLDCCASLRWAERVTAHRPYPDLDALLAAADEASYDLSPEDLTEALAEERSPGLDATAPQAAHTALRAAHAAYESRFGHAFVICLTGRRPTEHLNEMLGGIRVRMTNEQDEERAIAADELRRLARARLASLVTNHPEPDTAGVPH
ncbi:2-oxo-4-hydroxy-4-carboxy-5-ureidoimidazoline decarboxylase [Streptomyces crystallinus]|uniref:2-oxo-4-hydroxy-4-carboxy-5-ureidoimidazoline decarboxylase n=1 Tax=Streptomyces crystallinus TaxID=68191 RepID=A0ABP3Q9U4_9ACTN